ncbi:methyltransferase domain-containing protein [Sorangium sp. So ce1099]|uniref:methyltransferase domain-containing protein n=1 Tax=Sorangium sp. So ce1099 TaxID=3133331 RepID=UPI003F60C242
MSMDYVCIDSHQPLKRTRDDLLRCERSGREYPVVSGIPILVDDPSLLLRASSRSWNQIKSSVETKRAELEALLPGGLSERLQRRIAREIHARRANLDVISRYMTPLDRAAGEGVNTSGGAADFLSAHGSGWSLDWMLRYFAQDWTSSPDFATVSGLITSMIERHAPDREAIAVLGAGACGTARAVVDMFDATHGVDLSLPTLLLARGVLAGDDVVLNFEEIGWKPVRLQKPAPSARSVDLLVADVNRLPFRSGLASVVVTQYLMDLMVDPVVTALEIHRVLKPGGVWINFSNPMKLREEPLPYGVLDIADVPPLFEPVGFDVVQCDETRFTLLNFAHLDPAGVGSFQKVHHTVMRKRPEDRPASLAPRTRRSLDEPSCWGLVAHRVAARAVEIARVKTFGSPHDRSRLQIGVNGEFSEASSSDAELCEALMSLIDGRRTLDGIYTSLAEGVSHFSREMFLEIMSSMHDNFGVVDFRNPAG